MTLILARAKKFKTILPKGSLFSEPKKNKLLEEEILTRQRVYGADLSYQDSHYITDIRIWQGRKIAESNVTSLGCE